LNVSIHDVLRKEERHGLRGLAIWVCAGDLGKKGGGREKEPPYDGARERKSKKGKGYLAL